MTKKNLPIVKTRLDKIVGGGQTLATLEDGRKLFVWGGLPGELVEVQLTKKKSKMCEGLVTNVIEPSKDRLEPQDSDSYLSTSPWQIMSFESEQHYKAALIEEAFELHNIVLPNSIKVYSDNNEYQYRNKVEFSWYWNKETDKLDLAFFKRGTHSKISVEGTSLASPTINHAAVRLRDLLRDKGNIRASDLKTLLARCDADGNVIMQLYVKNPDIELLSEQEMVKLGVIGFELIYSNPKSPASVITKRLQSWGRASLTDRLMDIDFKYAVEGFFQINLPIYERVLKDMAQWVDANKPTIDLYSGVGTIGLTIGTSNLKLIESNISAVKEMKRNISAIGREDDTEAILAESENALDYIEANSNIIIDPPRAGLHEKVIDRLLQVKPQRIIYLSCNPVTQARDVALLLKKYKVVHHMGYNFFPRTPHIEHLVVMDMVVTE